MAEQHRCSETVFSGERWDFGGHPCSIKASVLEDGRWWCKRHSPAAKAARAAARDMKGDERVAAVNAATADLERLINRAGLYGAHPTKPTWAKFGDPPTGIYVPLEVLRDLVERMGGS